MPGLVRLGHLLAFRQFKCLAWVCTLCVAQSIAICQPLGLEQRTCLLLASR